MARELNHNSDCGIVQPTTDWIKQIKMVKPPNMIKWWKKVRTPRLCSRRRTELMSIIKQEWKWNTYSQLSHCGFARCKPQLTLDIREIVVPRPEIRFQLAIAVTENTSQRRLWKFLCHSGHSPCHMKLLPNLAMSHGGEISVGRPSQQQPSDTLQGCEWPHGVFNDWLFLITFNP